MNQQFENIESYLAQQTDETRKRLIELQAIIKMTAPKAVETVNYNMPAYALVKGGKRDKQIMIAGYKTFVSLYPGAGILDHFANELTDYKFSKAAVQFPNNKPLPKKLIAKIVTFKLKNCC